MCRSEPAEEVRLCACAGGQQSEDSFTENEIQLVDVDCENEVCSIIADAPESIGSAEFGKFYLVIRNGPQFLLQLNLDATVGDGRMRTSIYADAELLKNADLRAIYQKPNSCPLHTRIIFKSLGSGRETNSGHRQ